MAFEINRFGMVSVGLGNLPNIWSYSAPLGDNLKTIETDGYFTPLSDIYTNGEIKLGDLIHIVSGSQEIAIDILVFTPTFVNTSRLTPQERPPRLIVVPVTDGITPTQDQNGHLFHAETAGLTIDLPSFSSIAVGSYFRFNNTSSGTVTINPFGTQSIDGVASPFIMPAQSFKNLTVLGFQWSSI